MRNIDFNAYRAYKNVNDENKDGKRKNPYELLKGEHNLMKFPFGLKEERFRWQTTKNLGEKQELNGTMVRRQSQPSTNNWESLMNKTGELPERKGLNNRAASYKYALDRNSQRTVKPDMDRSFDDIVVRKKDLNKSTATGGIGNLIDKTPEIETYYKKFSEKKTQGSDIFKPMKAQDKPKYKLPVNMENIKNSGEYAGGKKYKNEDIIVIK
jgi:hypothetical protein